MIPISGVTEYRPPGSLRLDAGELDHLGPLLSFVRDQLTEIGGREREHLATEIGKPRLDFGISEAGIDLPIELVNNVGGRVLGRADTEPGARLKARYELAHGREVRQR